MNDDHGHKRLMHRMTISGLALGQERLVLGGVPSGGFWKKQSLTFRSINDVISAKYSVFIHFLFSSIGAHFV
mgnify:CR=1 FL=1